MCGIVGIIGKGRCAPLLREALMRLEYRGYDSCGIATISDHKLYIKKDKGTVAEVHGRLNFDDLPGNIGIAHTRWATHGAPSKENSHPHTDCKGEIAVVHNGIIENFFQLREELQRRGHIFKSKTDTEVIPHLIEEGISKGIGFLEAVKQCFKKIKGSYAILAIYAKEPDKIICIRKESPAIIGVGKSSFYCASDIPAFLPFTNEVIFLQDYEMAIIKVDGVEIIELRSGEKVTRSPIKIDWSLETAEKGGFPHFMLKEIHEQPYSLMNTLRTQEVYVDMIASCIMKARRVFLLGCGTSYNACLAASYIFSKLAKIHVQPVIASEFIEAYGDVIDSECVVLAVSQSGETADVLIASRYAIEKKATLLGITNVMGSSLTRIANIYSNQQSGPEIGVAATKTFTSQLMVLAMIALKIAEKKKTLTQDKIEELKQGMRKLPPIVKHIIDTQEEKVRYIAKKYAGKNSFCFLGRGINFATAMEGRLKLLELAYVPSLSYPAAEGKHGFISVIEEGFPVVFVAANDSTRSKLIGNMMEMKARGASLIAIVEQGDDEIKKIVDDFVEIPRGVPEVLSPIAYVIPLQLLAYYMAVEKGYDPDKPRHLAKSVTVE